MRYFPDLRVSYCALDELRGFGDLIADFAAQAAAGLWQVRVGLLPSTCSGIRLQKRAVLLARSNHGGGLFNDTHRRQHGPGPEAHPPNAGTREIRDFGKTLRHHDVDRQRRELSELLDESKVGEAGYKNSVSTGISISLCTLCRFTQAFIRRSEFQQKRIRSRIDEQTNSELLRSVPHCFDLRCVLIRTDELPLSAEEPVFDIDANGAGFQNLGHRLRGGLRRVAISCLQID